MNFFTIENFLKPIMLEIGFWGVLAGCAIVFILIIKESKPKELLIISACILLGFVLRLKFGVFAPIHEKFQYIEIINNYYQNFLSNNFWSVQHVYYGTFGFIEFFMNRFLYFFDSFNVYYVYYVNLIISLVRGVLLYYLARLLFKNKIISLFALLIIMVFPIEIKFSATEIQMQLVGLSFILFIALFVKFLHTRAKQYLVLLFMVCVANLFGRIDYAVIVSGLALLFILYLAVFDGKDKKNMLINIPLAILVLAILFLCNSTFYISLFTREYGAGYWSYTDAWVNLKNIYHIFFIQNYFGIKHPVHSFAFLKYYFIPIYFYFLLRFFWIIFLFKFKEKRHYFMITLLTGAMLVSYVLVSRPMNKHIRLAIPFFPLMAVLVSVALYRLLRLCKLSKKYVLIIGAAVILLSITQNLPFLSLELSRKTEQEFIISNINKIPENSLVLTLAEKLGKNSIFEHNNECRYTEHNHYVESRDFPYYLLAGRNIDVMDICQEYNKEIIDKYNNIFYYRGLYAHYGRQNINITTDFEKNHNLNTISSAKITNYDLHSTDVKNLLAGNSFPVHGNEGLLGLGFFSVIK